MSNIAFKQAVAVTQPERRANSLSFSKFSNWCSNQQENRLSWLAIAIAGHGCVLTPLTVFAVVNSGNNLILFMVSILAMAMVLITNLAALPTKITIPFLLGSVLVDLGILLTCGLL